jgi:hypothetical protein
VRPPSPERWPLLPVPEGGIAYALLLADGLVREVRVQEIDPHFELLAIAHPVQALRAAPRLGREVQVIEEPGHGIIGSLEGVGGKGPRTRRAGAPPPVSRKRPIVVA